MIRFEQVCKRYPGAIHALEDVSFSLAKGEMAIVGGHSGAGKTTLLKLIVAIERPSAGAVLLGGKNVGSLSRGAIPFLRRSVGLILQDRNILFDRSVFDNVALPLAIMGAKRADVGRRVRAALERVGLLAREKAAPIALSGGEQQRLAIARAIVNRPSLLIADEPTAHLDHDYARDIIELFGSFHRAGATVLIATHDESDFAAVRPRRLWLDHGRLAA